VCAAPTLPGRSFTDGALSLQPQPRRLPRDPTSGLVIASGGQAGSSPCGQGDRSSGGGLVVPPSRPERGQLSPASGPGPRETCGGSRGSTDRDRQVQQGEPASSSDSQGAGPGAPPAKVRPAEGLMTSSPTKRWLMLVYACLRSAWGEKDVTQGQAVSAARFSPSGALRASNRQAADATEDPARDQIQLLGERERERERKAMPPTELAKGAEELLVPDGVPLEPGEGGLDEGSQFDTTSEIGEIDRRLNALQNFLKQAKNGIITRIPTGV
jgi:hypothetical protein